MKKRTIKTVLIDDEQHCTASLAINLAELPYDITVLKSFNNPYEALSYLKENTDIDILFLDIEMPGMSGFELLKQLNQLSFEVIFVTAYNQYAINAFKFSAFDYLLKPIDDTDLEQCIERWLKKKQFGVTPEQLNYLDELLKVDRAPDKLALPTQDGLELVKICDIVHCNSDSNYTYFYFTDNTTLLICKTLKDVDTVLSKNGFIRIHQSYLINPQHIKKLVKHDGGYLIMSNGSKLRVSKNKKELINNIFNTLP